MKFISRRSFIQTGAAAGTAAAAIGRDTVMAAAAESPVRHREFGSTGYKVSEIGFGAMNMRDPELVHAAIDAGVNYIDTAHKYMNGINEEVIGQVMKTKRDKVFLTTKVADDDISTMTKNLDISLKRLNTDHVDLVLAHSLNEVELINNEEILRHMENAKKSGKARFVGYSTHKLPDEYMDATEKAEIYEAILVSYNYLSPPEVARNIERARKNGMAIIAMKTQAGGKGNPDAANSIQTPNQAALKWVLENQYVDTAIPGVTTFEMLAENLKVMGMKLTSRESRELRRYGEALKGNYCLGVLGCDGCREKCPKGVAVHDINRCLGYAYGYGDIRLAHENYADIPSGRSADVCADCDECEVTCVNGLNLTENIGRARTLFC